MFLHQKKKKKYNKLCPGTPNNVKKKVSHVQRQARAKFRTALNLPHSFITKGCRNVYALSTAKRKDSYLSPSLLYRLA